MFIAHLITPIIGWCWQNHRLLHMKIRRTLALIQILGYFMFLYPKNEVNFNMGEIGNKTVLETLILKCHMIPLRLDSCIWFDCIKNNPLFRRPWLKHHTFSVPLHISMTEFLILTFDMALNELSYKFLFPVIIQFQIYQICLFQNNKTQTQINLLFLQVIAFKQ